jgi:hypothetical protein
VVRWSTENATIFFAAKGRDSLKASVSSSSNFS